MNVLIDPYMFELKDTQEIIKNISFFQKLIKFFTGGYEDRHVLIYKGLEDRLSPRQIQLFPINVSDIPGRDLKDTVIQVNRSFQRAVLSDCLNRADIDECGGEQEFEIIGADEIAEDDLYFEMFYILLLPCYSNLLTPDKHILTGEKMDGGQPGDAFQIRCSCEDQQYINDFRFTDINELIPAKEKAKEILREMKRSGAVAKEETVRITMGDHHNHLQSDGNRPDTLNGLSYKNKIVLKPLCELGLFRIIFKRFTTQGVKETGSLRINGLEEMDAQDIVSVDFNAETGYQYLAELYFPKGVGKPLKDYFGSELITYKVVREFLDDIL